jgi:ribonucleoside-triphosphate reductase
MRTYQRPTDDAGVRLENWSEAIHRSTFKHHLHLQSNAGGRNIDEELLELEQLGLNRMSTVAGRTLWLGGTDYAYDRACCQFNCTATRVSNVYDFVDGAWLLFNGAGVGFKPQVGTLHGYLRPLKLQIINSQNDKDYRGPEDNVETPPTADNGWTWTIKVGDSAKAWSKALGKLFGSPHSRKAQTLVVSGENCRGPGGRLKGYGWICNGFPPLAKAMGAIHEILNRKAGNLLDEIDIMDCVNHVGEVLSSRRSAQFCGIDSTNPLVDLFALAKHEYWKCLRCGSHNTKSGICLECGGPTNNHRRQSNNSELFWSQPTPKQLLDLLHQCWECGGDPGIINAAAAQEKCPWFEIPNPCVEIMLGSFCNLVNNCLPRFKGNIAALERAVYLIARANYRQTCVNLNDGILQPRWHQNNDALRLCGVSLTGIVQAPWMTSYHRRRLRNAAITGAYSMADELGLPRPKAVTTITPGGTISKAMGGTDVGEIAEGIHKPLGQYILNWINFSQHDPLVKVHREAGYKVITNPQDGNNVLICFPVRYDNIKFDRVPHPKTGEAMMVNLEPATKQLDRYLVWANEWCDHNPSCTIYYDEQEIPEIAGWLSANWHRGYIATAFIRRTNPLLTPADVKQPYLPQEVVTEGRYNEYEKSLHPVDYTEVTGTYDMIDEGCDRGCPAR